MKITILGSGYIGIITAVGFAIFGHEVICFDKDKKKINYINKGKSFFYEKNLEKYLKKYVNNNKIWATANFKKAIENSDITFITVGTPLKNDRINLSFVKDAFNTIKKNLKFFPKNHVISIKSTIVPGTTNLFYKVLLKDLKQSKTTNKISLTVNPEFLSEGSAIKDFINQDRIVVGYNDLNGKKVLKKLYSNFDRSNLYFTTFNTAEMSKYFSNIFFSTLISFSNEFANLCNNLSDVDFLDVIQTLKSDRRLKFNTGKKIKNPDFVNFLNPGIGFGGSCFPKDTKAFLEYAKSKKNHMNVLNSVIKTNNNQIYKILNILLKIDNNKKKEICILGLSFKPDTDDVRESPSIGLIKLLLTKGYNVKAHDPKAINNFKKLNLSKKIIYIYNLNKLLLDSKKIIILVTCWLEYKVFLENNNDTTVPIIDCRRFLNKKIFKNYYGIGIKS